MKRINVLHLTDLHCGAPSHSRTMGDPKDPTISTSTVDELIYSNSMNCFYRRAKSLLDGRHIDVIACTGDLGYRHQPETIEAGARYLSLLGDRLEVPRNNIIVCPGNHDVDREAGPGNELKDFIDACSKYEFSFANWTNPARLLVQNIAFIGLNTCLGATERALHELPETLWEAIKESVASLIKSSRASSSIPELLKEKLIDMDIPAVGHSQMDGSIDFILDNPAKNDTVIVLGHHNILPTPNIEVRPYANMVDAGVLLLRLIEHRRKVLFLHGHTHCDISLTALSPDNDNYGFLASIGDAGFFGDSNPTVTYIELFVDDSGNFLNANISPYSQRGNDFGIISQYSINSPPMSNIITDIDIGNLPKGTCLSFKMAAQKLEREPDEDFAADMLRISSCRQVEVTGIASRNLDEWNITRI